MGGHNNSTTRELYRKRKQGGKENAEKSAILYKEFIEDPTAQYEMTFLQYKSLGKRRGN